MNQFMMNQFAAAAAVNNKQAGLEGLGFAQQQMINPQTLMYQNQLMYQARIKYPSPIHVNYTFYQSWFRTCEIKLTI